MPLSQAAACPARNWALVTVEDRKEGDWRRVCRLCPTVTGVLNPGDGRQSERLALSSHRVFSMKVVEAAQCLRLWETPSK